MVQRTTLLVVAFPLLVLLGSCGESGGDASTTPLPETPARDLAQQLVAAGDLETATRITREVLARGGVATVDGDRVLVDTIGPASPFRATSLESLHLALEARHRPQAGRLTVAEFAQMLEGFGWPFRDARPDQAAYQPSLDALPEDIREIARQEADARDRDARDAGDAGDRAVESARNASRDREQALVAQLREATLAWQHARQAWGKSAPADKPAAQVRVDEAMAARKALIEERRVAQLQSRDALEAMRTQARATAEGASRLQEVAERIGPDHAAGEQLMELLAAWVREAAKDPDDPLNFTPLFLAEMARLQDPPFDLAGTRFSRPGRGAGPPVDLRGPPRSEQLRLTLLELQLIAAAFHRGAHADAVAADAGAPWSSAAGSLADAVFPPAHAQSSTPCSDFKKELRRTAGDVAGEGAAVVASEALGKALESAANVGTDGYGEAFGKMMGSLGIASKIIKLVAFYADAQVTVHAAPDPTHKPPAGNFGIAYTATAGVSEDELEEYERLNADPSSKIQRDCYATLGLPTLTNIAELAGEAENWVVEWRIVEGQPRHVDIGPLSVNKFKKGQFGVLGMQLERTAPHAASARFIVVQTRESGHTGTLVRTYATVKASVNAAGTPSLGTWVNALKGGLGLADALVELAAGWTQSMVKPKAYASVEIAYHCPRPTTLHDTADPVADGGGDDDAPDSCLLEAAKGR